MSVRIVGIDLAAQAPKTGLCVLAEDGGRVRAERLTLGADDPTLLEATRGAAKIGMDAPLGWPDDFLEFLEAQRTGDAGSLCRFQGKAGMDRLSFRETDRDIHARLRKLPLSVSADKIARVAMRAAVLQTAWADELGPSPRDGSAALVEVYPAAALITWFPAGASYKHPEAGRQRRAELVASIRAAAPWLELSSQQADLAVAHDDALDALVSALVAWAAHLGSTQGPPTEHVERARREGWIHVPAVGLEELAPR